MTYSKRREVLFLDCIDTTQTAFITLSIRLCLFKYLYNIEHLEGSIENQQYDFQCFQIYSGNSNPQGNKSIRCGFMPHLKPMLRDKAGFGSLRQLTI